MADVLFISESYLKEMSVINENVDYKILKPTIIMVQDLYIQQVLGTPLYNDLKAKITADSTLAANPNEKALIDNYIAKALVWYVKKAAILEFKFRYANKGIMVKSSQDSQPADTSDLKLLTDDCRMHAERYSQLLTDYLRLNTATFPKYLEVTTTGMNPIKKNYTNGVFMRNYTDRDCESQNYNGSNNCQC